MFPKRRKYIFIYTHRYVGIYTDFSIYIFIFSEVAAAQIPALLGAARCLRWSRSSAGIADTPLQLFPPPSSPEIPPPTSPTPLSRRVAARCSLILIMRLSLERRPGAANTGAPSSSASNQSNKVLLLRSSSSKEDDDDREELGVSQVILIQPYLIFIIKLVQLLIEGRISWPPRAFALVKTGWFKTKKRTDRAALRGESADEGIAG